MSSKVRVAAAAVAALAILGLAACGDDDDDVTTQPAVPAAPAPADVSGSDQHLENLADDGAVNAFEAGNQAASDRLQGQADQIAEAQAKAKAAQAAEDLERQAHLDGQARTYGQ